MKLLLLPAALLLLANDAGAPVEVQVSGVRSASGMLVVDICPEGTFLKKCPYEVKVPARQGVVTVVVHDVPPGRYAVQAWHDANGNGDLDRNFLGIPMEGIGFSNDAMPRLMRPKFAKAAFDHGTNGQHMAVTLRYFLG